MQRECLFLSSCLLVAAPGCASEEAAPTLVASQSLATVSHEPAVSHDPAVPHEQTASHEQTLRRAEDPAPADPSIALIASGAFATDADRERFETEILPSARAFLAYWAMEGLTVPHPPARLFVSPPPGTRATDALPQLYGEDIFDELRALESDVASSPSNRDAIERIDAFACAHPPLERNFLEEVEEHVDDPEIGPADIARALRDEHDQLLGPDGTFSFSTDNGEFELPLRRSCSYTLLGHATEPTRAHPYLEKDVVHHELGHALHYGLWLSSGPLGERLSTSANEAIADILAHVFDADPCHGKVLDERGTPVGCRRRMDGYERSVSDAVWQRGRADHESGQALRQLVWALRDEVAPDALRAAIAGGIAAVQVALNRIDEEPLANVPVFDDEILAVRYRFAREYDASSAFHDAVCDRLCNTPTACNERAARIGDPRLEMRETWLANAPTTIGESGVTLSDGRQVAFHLDGALIVQMTVTLPSGEQHSYAGDPDRGWPEIEADPTSRRITLWFPAPESELPATQIGWTSDGELTTR